MTYLIALVVCLAAPKEPQTRAERTGYKETSHYTDVIGFIETLQKQGAPINLQYIGTTKEGRRIPLVIATRRPCASAKDAQDQGLPIFYIQANIHAGEVEGKEAILHLLRKWCRELSGVLDRAILVINPIYNADGNEKWGPGERNRPEQGGPAIVGVRASGEGFDLNRDCIKAESLEMRASLASIYNVWNPDLIMDLHTTDGTRHGYEMTYAPPLNPNTEPTVMRFARDEMLPTLRHDFRQKLKMEMFDYGNATNGAWLAPGAEGWYVTSYAGLRNRVGILTEAPTYLPFKDRVIATERLVQGVVDYCVDHAGQLIRMNRAADEAVAKLPPRTKLGVRFDFESRGEEDVLLEKPQTPSPTGRPKSLVSVRMPVRDRFKSTKFADVPAAYLIPEEQTATIRLLLRHGISVERLKRAWSGVVDRFTSSEVITSPTAFQGHKLNRLEGRFEPQEIKLAPGTFVVRSAQPLAVLAFTILEPESLDGVAAWGVLGEPDHLKNYPIYKTFDKISVETEPVELSSLSNPSFGSGR